MACWVKHSVLNSSVQIDFLFSPSCDDVTLAYSCVWAEREAANGAKLMRHIDSRLSSLIRQCSSKSYCNEDCYVQFFKKNCVKSVLFKGCVLSRSRKWRLAVWFPALLKDLLCWSKWCLTVCRDLLPSSWNVFSCASPAQPNQQMKMVRRCQEKHLFGP